MIGKRNVSLRTGSRPSLHNQRKRVTCVPKSVMLSFSVEGIVYYDYVREGKAVKSTLLCRSSEARETRDLSQEATETAISGVGSAA